MVALRLRSVGGTRRERETGREPRQLSAGPHYRSLPADNLANSAHCLRLILDRKRDRGKSEGVHEKIAEVRKGGSGKNTGGGKTFFTSSDVAVEGETR